LLTILIFLICLSIVNATGVILSEENVQNEITENGYASFDLIVQNDDRKDRDIFITFPYSSNWRVNINPYLLRLNSKGVKTANVQIFSLNEKNVGTYELLFNIKSRDEEINEEYIHRVKVMPFSGDEIVTQLVVPERIDPRTQGKIKLKLENMRKVSLEGLEINIKSEGVFSEKRFVDLDVNEIRLEEFTFTFPEDLEPRRYNINAEVKYGNKVVGSSKDTFILAGFTDVVEKTSNEGTLLTKKLVVSKINGGTAEKSDSIIVSIPKYKKLFTTFSKEPDSFSLKDGSYVAVWNFNLGSGDVFKVEIITSYVFIFWSLVVVLLVIAFILQLQKKRIIVTKQVMDVDKDKEGISGMKVLLHMRNRGRRSIENIRLIDTLPMFIGTNPHSFGTLHPTKIKKTSFGNKIVWDINELHPGEERIISYVAKSRLSVIGKLILPSAVAIYKRGNKKIKSRSAKLILLTTLKEEMR